jgi:hypothetical protein
LEKKEQESLKRAMVQKTRNLKDIEAKADNQSIKDIALLSNNITN